MTLAATPDQIAADRERLSHTVLAAHHDRLTEEQAEDAESRRPPQDPVPRVAEQHEIREPRVHDWLTFAIGIMAAGLFGALVGHWAL